MPCCRTFYHKKCLERWFAKSKVCPLCKSKVNISKNELKRKITYQLIWFLLKNKRIEIALISSGWLFLTYYTNF